MSPLDLVLLALLGGAVGVLLLLGVGILLWIALRLKSEVAALGKLRESVQTETAALLEKSQSEIIRINAEHASRLRAELDSAKAGLAAIRADVKQAWDGQMAALAALLERHRGEMQSGIEKINGEALQAAAVRLIRSTQSLEKLVGLVQSMMVQAGLVDTGAAPGKTYGPEEFAEEEDHHFGTPPSGYSLSPVATLDAQAEREEQGAAPPEPESA